MTDEEKHKFNYLNNTSYLVRLILEKSKFEIQHISINDYSVWHVTYMNHTIGTITFNNADDGYTYTNVRLYKYFKEKFPKCKDLILSDYYEEDEGIKVKFLFNKFDEWAKQIKESVLTLGERKSEVEETTDDMINSLREFVEENYDEKFSKNRFLREVKYLLQENDRLHEMLAEKSDQIMDLFLKLT